MHSWSTSRAGSPACWCSWSPSWPGGSSGPRWHRARRPAVDHDGRLCVRGYFVQRYGDWILLSPEASGLGWLVWGLPVLAVLGGAGVAMAHTGRRPTAVSAADVDHAANLAALYVEGRVALPQTRRGAARSGARARHRDRRRGRGRRDAPSRPDTGRRRGGRTASRGADHDPRPAACDAGGDRRGADRRSVDRPPPGAGVGRCDRHLRPRPGRPAAPERRTPWDQ
ncbi:cytochrome c-type biogenesis protein CcmH [Euzebya sp.]|uniref:cytochrome c-type biogenesis protein n=1 Tax=Euzebya sp. TaxID=1971409 RepID=UPI0035147FBC